MARLDPQQVERSAWIEKVSLRVNPRVLGALLVFGAAVAGGVLWKGRDLTVSREVASTAPVESEVAPPRSRPTAEGVQLRLPGRTERERPVPAVRQVPSARVEPEPMPPPAESVSLSPVAEDHLVTTPAPPVDYDAALEVGPEPASVEPPAEVYNDDGNGPHAEMTVQPGNFEGELPASSD